MKKIILCAVIITAGTIAAMNVNFSSNNRTSSLWELANVEALAVGESERGYTRVTKDCSYSGTATAGSTVTVGSVSITVGKTGAWSYTAKDAEVRCILNGSELCIPQNCPAHP